MDSSLKDPFGGIMPPCIVMEKGESLQDRAQNSRVDVFTAAQARLHLQQPFPQAVLLVYQLFSPCPCSSLVPDIGHERANLQQYCVR